MLSSLRTGKFWDTLRSDSRFAELLELLESKETHTSHYDFP